MSDTRHKDGNWKLLLGSNGYLTWDQAQIAILMDIRDELKQINWTLGCHNTLAIPGLLRSIKTNTAKRKRKPVKVL